MDSVIYVIQYHGKRDHNIEENRWNDCGRWHIAGAKENYRNAEKRVETSQKAKILGLHDNKLLLTHGHQYDPSPMQPTGPNCCSWCYAKLFWIPEILRANRNKCVIVDHPAQIGALDEKLNLPKCPCSEIFISRCKSFAFLCMQIAAAVARRQKRENYV